MLTDLELAISRKLGGLVPEFAPDGENGSWVFNHWSQELVLWLGSLLLGILLAPAMIIGGLAGGIWGQPGYQAGLNLGTAVVAFAASGMVLHLFRLLVLRAYWMATARQLGMVSPLIPVRPPGNPWRTLLASSDWDGVFQLLCSAATGLILFLSSR